VQSWLQRAQKRNAGVQTLEFEPVNHSVSYVHIPTSADFIQIFDLPWFSAVLVLSARPLQLINQTQLPPQTTRIGRGVHYLPDARCVEVDNLTVVAIQGEMGKLRTTGNAKLGERGKVLLQGHRGRVGFHHSIIRCDVGAKEGVRYVLPVERRWNAELVGISLVAICTV